MAFRETRYFRNGVPVPIQCLTMRRKFDLPKELSFHYHDYIELLFGVSGEATAYVGTESYPLVAGAMILIQSEVFHDVKSFGTEGEYIVIKFLPSVLFSEEQTAAEYAHMHLLVQGLEGGKIYFSPDETHDAPFAFLFSRLMEEWDAQNFGYQLALRADVTSLVLAIMRKWVKDDPTLADATVSEAQGALCNRAVEYVKAHYVDLTEEACAEALGVSRGYLSRIFKKGMSGVAFSAYLIGVKLKEAEKLLLSTDMSMTDIAEAVGFSTVAYFIATFRRRYGVPPARYRKLLRGEA